MNPRESWIDREMLVRATGWCGRTIQRKVERGELQSRATGKRYRNGEPEREYLLPASSATSESTALAIRQQELPLFASVSETAGRSAVPDGLRELVRQKFDAIRPLLDFQRKNHPRPAISLTGGKSVETLNDLAEYIAEQQQPKISVRTLFRWLEDFKTEGYVGLAPKIRRDKGRSRFFEEHKSAGIFVQQKFLVEGLTIQLAWEALCRDWKKVEKHGAPPSYRATLNFLNALPEGTKVLAREGKESYVSKCSPSVLRKSPPPMDWWIADHRCLDVLNRNTMFAEMRRDEAYRLWVTAIYDWGSRKIVGLCLAPTPSSRTINSALRMAVLSHGFPRNFYWDNGKDFKKVRNDLELIALSEAANQLLKGKGISVTSALPKHPRSKPIESYFAGWSKRFDPLWRPSYLGNKPSNRPESANEAQKQHRDFLKGKRRESPLPTDAEVICAAVQWTEEFNARPLKALKGGTPNDAMEKAHPECSRSAVSPRLLDTLFSERVTRVVQRGGTIQLENTIYEPTDESIVALSSLQGREVTILRDPYNLGDAVAVDADMHFIGELRVQAFLEQSPNGHLTRDAINAAMRKQRGLKRLYASYIDAVRMISSNQGWQTEREALIDRAALASTGTDGRADSFSDRFSSSRRAAPGARRALPPIDQVPSSPFVSDAVNAFLEAERTEDK